MALSITLAINDADGVIQVIPSGAQSTQSRIEVQRRMPPLLREADVLAFIPRTERYHEPVLTTRLTPGRQWWDYAVRSGGRYQYRAREHFANGAIQSWTPWRA